MKIITNSIKLLLSTDFIAAINYLKWYAKNWLTLLCTL